MELRKIHCSSLTMYPDCNRREATKMFTQEIKSFGYKLHKRPPAIGAVIGQATHTGAAYTLRSKLETGELGNAREADQRALETMKREGDDGVVWDQTTKDHNTGQVQTLRQVRSYRVALAPKIKPIAVEGYLEAEFLDRAMLVGSPDNCEPRTVRDLKTGVRRRANAAQYGGYALLRRSNNEIADELLEDFVPRVSLKKEQPEPETIAHDPALAEQLAWQILQRIVHDYERFLETKDPSVFIPNPNSMLCGEKYCPAFNSEFCKAHRK